MITIIIPVYNSSLYLDECVESVIKQTFQDWECILVDDGSTDDSSRICDKWCKTDSRIKVIHQKNQGVSAARNHGIAAAKGEYITFVDSDDWITPQYLSAMLAAPIADLVVSGITRRYFSNEIPDKSFLPGKASRILLGKDALDMMIDLSQKYLIFGPCTKLYRTSIITDNNIKFPEACSMGEDMEFNFKYLNFIRTISCINQSNYNYRIQNEGTLSTKLSENRFNNDYRQWLIQREFFIENDMWDWQAKELLYKRLWGIVYDGIFRGINISGAGYGYIHHVLSIKEICDLSDYSDFYPCAKWIKYAITHKLGWCFYGYYILNRYFH